MARFLETDIGTRAYRLATGINEAIMTGANEPSLGLYRLQEHCISNVPKLIKERQAIEEVSTRAKGINFDLTYDIEAVREIGKVDTFPSIISDLQSAIATKQLLREREQNQRAQQLGRQATPPKTYGSTGESPPLLRRGNGYSINNQGATTPPTYSTGAGGDYHIQPKKFL